MFFLTLPFMCQDLDYTVDVCMIIFLTNVIGKALWLHCWDQKAGKMKLLHKRLVTSSESSSCLFDAMSIARGRCCLKVPWAWWIAWQHCKVGCWFFSTFFWDIFIWSDLNLYPKTPLLFIILEKGYQSFRNWDYNVIWFIWQGYTLALVGSSRPSSNRQGGVNTKFHSSFRRVSIFS